jgi:hypothetical protein
MLKSGSISHKMFRLVLASPTTKTELDLSKLTLTASID